MTMSNIKIKLDRIGWAVDTAQQVEEAANGGGKLVNCRIVFAEEGEQGFGVSWNPTARRWYLEVPVGFATGDPVDSETAVQP